jgi:hypothetical protein
MDRRLMRFRPSLMRRKLATHHAARILDSKAVTIGPSLSRQVKRQNFKQHSPSGARLHRLHPTQKLPRSSPAYATVSW